MPADERRAFVQSVIDAKRDQLMERNGMHSSEGGEAPWTEIDAETFQAISELYHYAILELTFVDGFESEARWIARRLGITVIEAQYAVARLLRLGLLEERDGRLVKAQRHVTTQNKAVTNPALRAQHKEILRQSGEAMREIPIERRSHTAITMTLDPEKIPLAKQMIQEFGRRLCEVMETGERKEVYQFHVGFFPLTRGGKESEEHLRENGAK